MSRYPTNTRRARRARPSPVRPMPDFRGPRVLPLPGNDNVPRPANDNEPKPKPAPKGRWKPGTPRFSPLGRLLPGIGLAYGIGQAIDAYLDPNVQPWPQTDYPGFVYAYWGGSYSYSPPYFPGVGRFDGRGYVRPSQPQFGNHAITAQAGSSNTSPHIGIAAHGYPARYGWWNERTTDVNKAPNLKRFAQTDVWLKINKPLSTLEQQEYDAGEAMRPNTAPLQMPSPLAYPARFPLPSFNPGVPAPMPRKPPPVEASPAPEVGREPLAAPRSASSPYAAYGTNSGHPSTPPRKGEKEKKNKMQDRLFKALNVFGQVTELMDITEAAWDALPEDCKTKTYYRGRVNTSAYDKIMDVYRCADHMDIMEFVRNLVLNNAQDFIIGFENRLRNKVLPDGIDGIDVFNWLDKLLFDGELFMALDVSGNLPELEFAHEAAEKAAEKERKRRYWAIRRKKGNRR